jgi:hypothetical protein
MMDDVEYLRAQRNLARQALVNSLRDSAQWVKSGTMVRQATRRYPWPIVGASVIGGYVLGSNLAGLVDGQNNDDVAPSSTSDREKHASVIGNLIKLGRMVGII